MLSHDPLPSSGPVVDLHREASQSSPMVRCDWSMGVIEMRGESYPENSFELYGAILSWMTTFLRDGDRPLRLELELNYLNTSSVRAMISLFDQLQAASDAGREVLVNWYHDPRNPRAAELGEELREDYSFPFAIQAIDP